MKTVAFYSFKGGVGRTSALFNVAYLLAEQERATVVVADWDVHAPGLTCLYDLQPPDGPRLRAGVVDVLAALADAAPGEDVLDPADLIHPTRVGRRLADAGKGDLWLVTAGAFDPADDGAAYLAKVQGLTPKIQGLARAGRADLVKWFAGRVAAGFAERAGKPLDYLLLDARTGLTEVGELLLSEATDQVVVLFGLNAQNQLGMEQTLRQLTNGFGPANVASRVVLVASPVPAGEEALKARKLAAARSTIERVVEELSRKASAGDATPIAPVAPRLLSIPYHPLLALDEELIAERYPESDPGRAYDQIKEVVQNRGLAKIEETKARVASAVGRGREERTALPGGVSGVEHPLARLLRWNVVRPEATTGSVAPAAGNLAEPFLDGLANSIGMSSEDKARLLDTQSQHDNGRIEEIVYVFEYERRRLRELPSSIWPSLAGDIGRCWAEWAILSGRRLGVPLQEAARRLLEEWPSQLDGEGGAGAVFAAIDVLLGGGEVPPDVLREFLERVSKVNPALDFAAGGIAAVLFEAGIYVDEARNLFAKAADLAPSEATFHLAFRIQQTGTRLLSRRMQDALLLMEQACVHYKRAVALKPDKHEAEVNWGDALNVQAQAVASSDLPRALVLWEEAGRHYERALALKPDKHEAECNWGVALRAQAQAVASSDLPRALVLWEEAGRHYERALALKPDMHEVENNWGNALAAQAQAVMSGDLPRALLLWEEAGRHFERALALKPDHHGILHNFIASELHRHHLLHRAGREAEARTVAERTLELARRHDAMTGKPSYNLACALAVNGHDDDALGVLETLHSTGTLVVNAAHLSSDPDMAHLAGHPRFIALLDALRAPAAPTAVDPAPAPRGSSQS